MTSGQGVLYNLKQEKFCQLVAMENVPPAKAFKAVKQSGGPKIGAPNATQLMQLGPVQARIATLMERAAHRAELTYEGIISELHEEARLARVAGQHSAAMKGWELLGRELERMFSQHVEIDHHHEFAGMSEDELRAFIVSQMAELGLDDKTIEGKALPAPTAKEED